MYTVKVYFVGHGTGEASFPQESDAREYVRAIIPLAVRYTLAPGDYVGKPIPPGVGRTYGGEWANHYD